MSNTPEWYLLHTFLIAATQGSLSAAARTLGSTQPTVSRQIQLLEEKLGYTLFSRSREGLTLTEAGIRLLPGVEAMHTNATQALRALSDTTTGHIGTVRITCSHIVGIEVLPAILAGLRCTHPKIHIELSLSNRIENLTRGDADIGIRMIKPVQSHLIAKRLANIRLGLYAHQDYLKENGTPHNLQDLHQHALIGFDQDQRYIRIIRHFGLEPEHFSFRSDSDLAQLAALRSGCGIGLCHIGIARHHPSLIPVLSDEIQYSMEMWLTMHKDMRTTQRIRIIFDYLAQALSVYYKN